MASTSPDQQDDGRGASSDQEKGPLSSLKLGFLKNLNDKRSTRDGNPPKRRGPKPDSKPALTRRQELNRQAQRTHRERKEHYVKALEDEVLRLKEIFSHVSQDKDKLFEENKQLRQLLVQNSIPVGNIGLHDETKNSLGGGGGGGYATGTSTSGFSQAQGSRTAFTPPLTSNSTVASGSPSNDPSHAHSNAQNTMTGQQMSQVQAQGSKTGVDYEQAGIDFVLSLEKPCMQHLPFLLEQSIDGDGELSGHALMASCPPERFAELTPEIPFGYSTVDREGNSQQRTWELSKADLGTLLDLSRKLDLNGEITPVMAWGMVLAHHRLHELKLEEIRVLADELSSKVRCYGFGAVMEEFEVRDAMETVFGA